MGPGAGPLLIDAGTGQGASRCEEPQLRLQWRPIVVVHWLHLIQLGKSTTWQKCGRWPVLTASADIMFVLPPPVSEMNRTTE